MSYRQFFLVWAVCLFCSAITAAQNGFPAVLEQVAPKYPAAAHAVRATGTVQLRVEVDPNGKTISVIAFTGHTLLKRMAEVTVEKWRFAAEPGTHFLIITINFRIGDQAEDIVTVRGPYNIDLLGHRSRIIQNEHPGY